MNRRKKLIEVALPLAAINAACVREKSIRHGHPSTMHLWWARRPLAACRAVLFASFVDDPSSRPDEFTTVVEQDRERQRLFRLIEDLVRWENSNDPQILASAREEILRSTGGHPPAVLDPFCGGGSIPLEAQRLALGAHGSDLNPVAVLITKAMVEVPPRFAGRSPVNPESRAGAMTVDAWRGSAGLAADVRHYGYWMNTEAERRIGHLYPPAKLPATGGDATVIAWLWARTVACPNPVCGADMPLVRSFDLSTKRGKRAWIEPIVDQDSQTVNFAVRTGAGAGPEGTVNRRGARCLVCGEPVPFPHVRAEGKAGRMGRRMLAVVVEGTGGRSYAQATAGDAHPADSAVPTWRPSSALPHNPRDFKTPNYGMSTFADVYTERQLVALTTFSDLLEQARQRVFADAVDVGLSAEGVGLAAGGRDAVAYSEAVTTYLALAVDKAADYWSSICSWHSSGEKMRNTFARQAIPMVWDYAECNPFSNSTGNWTACVDWVWKVVGRACDDVAEGVVSCVDAVEAVGVQPRGSVISTDPPYYDNIG
ncbi:DUF1156 domain-containing protein, partial [Candidatus Poribacteria bacterium]|nr:DUF1156 domain-containing protein [Candidatus Poribacteria bacterium]